VTLNKRLITQSDGKWAGPEGLSLTTRYSSKLVAYLDSPNCVPRASISALSGATGRFK
jgi:hypothetical protein